MRARHHIGRRTFMLRQASIASLRVLLQDQDPSPHREPPFSRRAVLDVRVRFLDDWLVVLLGLDVLHISNSFCRSRVGVHRRGLLGKKLTWERCEKLEHEKETETE